MNNTTEWAEKAVAAFKSSLDENKQKQLAAEDYDRLTMIVNETIGDALLDATEQVDEIIRQLRANIEKPELGI